MVFNKLHRPCLWSSGNSYCPGVVEYFGGDLSILDYPMHGKKIKISGQHGALFTGLPQDGFQVGVYHSLYANKQTFPDVLNILAESEQGIVMAIEHKTLPIWAVQFHPESILSLGEKSGFKIVENVVQFLTTKVNATMFIDTKE